MRVTVRAASTATAPAIEVEDDGPGIAAAERERVFEPFRASTRRRETRPGSGLGLALVAQQARLHGADVAVAESPLGGALLRIAFPAQAP